jgi:hypothetical protein
MRNLSILAALGISMVGWGGLQAQGLTQIDIIEVQDRFPSSGGTSNVPPQASEPSKKPSTRPAGPATRPVSEVIKPTLVTLDFKDAPAKAVFEEFEKQGKIKLNLSPPDLFTRTDSKITIKVKDEPWLAVLLDLCEQAGVLPSNYGDRWNINMGGDRRMKGIRAASGPAISIIHSATIDSSIRYGTPPVRSRRMTLNGMLLIEPRLTSATLVGVRNIRAEDDLGRPLTENEDQSIRPNPNMGDRRDFSIWFDLPDNQGTKLPRVQADLDCLLPTEFQTLKIPDLLNSEGKAFKLGSATFTVDKVVFVNQSYSITLNVEPGSIDPSTFTRLRSNLGRAAPKQANSKVPVNIYVTNVTSGDGNAVIQFQVRENRPTRKAGEDGPIVQVDLEWELPTEYQTVAIPLELKDIPIPK